MDQRISLVTLGVADVSRARAFYERLGWRASSESQDAVAFFQAGGTAVALYGRDALAHDCGLPPAAPGTVATTLSLNCVDRAEVDAVLDEMVQAGATLLKAGHPAAWGGYIGYVADPDGHVWEVAHNPFWPLDEKGNVLLPA